VENPLSEQELDPIATRAIEEHNVDAMAHPSIQGLMQKMLKTLNSKQDKIITDEQITGLITLLEGG
jgi:hypothetical protein